MNKTLTIKAEMNPIIKNGKGEVIINIEPIATDFFSSLELIGIFEFVKKNYGNIKASTILMKVIYSEKGIATKIWRKGKAKFLFSLADVCDKLTKAEIENMLNRVTLLANKKFKPE